MFSRFRSSPNRPGCSRKTVLRSARSFQPRLEALEDRLTPGVYNVTNTNDAGAGSLRQAITQMNADMDVVNTINLNTISGTISLLSALPTVERNATWNGPGATTLTVQRSTAAGTPAFRVLHLGRGGTIIGLTIANGRVDDPPLSAPGGGIVSSSPLVVRNSIISGNTAILGGGIYMATNQGTMEITDSVIVNNTAADGGGIYQIHTTSITISNSRIDSNTAPFGLGGGIYNVDGTITIRDRSRIMNNQSQVGGGGIYNFGTDARVIIEDSTFHSNTSQSHGGGIHNVSTNVNALEIRRSTFKLNKALGNGLGGAINTDRGTIVNSTISGNEALKGGGIYERAGAILILNGNTITQNVARAGGGGPALGPGGGEGGGLFVETGAVATMVNTIIAGNAADFYPDVVGKIDSLGHNLIGDGTGASGFRPDLGDQVGFLTVPYVIDPLLAPLGDYGGPTETHILLPGSPALDTGDSAEAELPFDQRGFARLVGVVDIGAVEMQPGEAQAAYARGLRAIPVSRRLR